MTIEEVDVTKMCAETYGYFTPERVAEAFWHQREPSAVAEALNLFRGKTLTRVLDIYSHSTYQTGGPYELAAIRFIARFFPKCFYD